MQVVSSATQEPDIISFQQALHLFLMDCEIRNLRPFTVDYYRREITYLYRALREQKLETSPSLITRDMIRENFILPMKKKGLKITTINDRLRAVRAFFNFLYADKKIKFNPYDGIRLLKNRQEVIQSFTDSQINALMRQPDLSTFSGLRDYTFMMLLLDTGIRLSEVYGTDITDILWTDKRLHVRNTKGFRERLIPITDRMIKQLKVYIRIRGDVTGENALFVSMVGKRMARSDYQHKITEYGNQAGIADQVRCSPHTFRHTFARLSVMNGAGIFDLQSIMGHSNLEMAKTYVHLFSDDIRKHHDEFSPLKNIEKRF